MSIIIDFFFGNIGSEEKFVLFSFCLLKKWYKDLNAGTGILLLDVIAPAGREYP